MGAVIKKIIMFWKKMALLGTSFFDLFPTISLQILSLPLFTFPEDSPALSQPSHLLHLITYTKSMQFICIK